MAAHRYWRFLFERALGANYISVGECELHNSIGGANLTGSGTASASSTYAGYPASQAFANDGWSDAKSWCSNSVLSAWLQYDFGSGNSYDIVEFILTAPTTYGYLNNLFISFQYSDDASTWVTVNRYTGFVWTAGESKTFATGTVANSMVGKIKDAAPTMSFATMNTIMFGKINTYDTQDGGSYKISGIANRAGVPTQRKVALFCRKDHRMIKEVVSNTDGSYLFDYIKYIQDGYFIVEFDDPSLAQPYNAAIADFVTPVSM